MSYKHIILIAISAIVFSSCSFKEEQDYNKPALFWYNKMLKDINDFQLDNADDTYVSLESEHRKSPLLSSAIMIIADAHMQDEKYELAIYYYDSYLQKFHNNNLQDYVQYLKIKAKFMSFKQQFRDQKLISDILKDTNTFIASHQKSPYIYLIKTMQSRLYMSKAILDLEIASLYDRKDKPKAREYYEKKASKNWKDTSNIKKVSVPWYRYLFE